MLLVVGRAETHWAVVEDATKARNKIFSPVGFVRSAKRQTLNAIESVAVFDESHYGDFSAAGIDSIDIPFRQFGVRQD